MKMKKKCIEADLAILSDLKSIFQIKENTSNSTGKTQGYVFDDNMLKFSGCGLLHYYFHILRTHSVSWNFFGTLLMYSIFYRKASDLLENFEAPQHFPFHEEGSHLIAYIGGKGSGANFHR